MKHKEQRVLVLFDVQNMYYSCKHFYDTKVNFKEILKTAVAGRKLVRSIAYVIKTEIKEEEVFHDALHKIGIEVKAKDLQIFPGGSKKGDWDIGIAMDAVRLAEKVDTVVLVSGDGDFSELLQYLKSHGCRCEVIAFGQTLSKFLRDEADDITDLSKNTSKYLIGKPKKGGAPKPPKNSPAPAPKQNSKPFKKPYQKSQAPRQPPTRQAPPKLNDVDPEQEDLMKANMDQV